MLQNIESINMLEKIGVKTLLPYVTADSVFSLRPYDLDIGKDLLKREGFDIENERLEVSISVRKWSCSEKSSIQSHKKYIHAIADVADYLVENKNTEVIFASICTDFGRYYNDDRIIAHDVIENIKNAAKIQCDEYSPMQLSSIYGNMDTHIGTMIHSNILTMLHGTSTVAIQYEFKTCGLMNFFGFNDFVVDINSINSESLIQLVEKTISKRQWIQQIFNKFPELKQQADNAMLVYTLFDSK